MSESPPRDDVETTTRRRRCPVVAAWFVPVHRQRYDTNACRQVAYRRRRGEDPADAAPPPVAGPRRTSTVYECGECSTRYLGQQWCPECNQPCRRVGPGGSCPACEEPVALADLAPTSASR